MTTEATLNANAAATPTSKSFARHLPTVARVLMGILLFGPGLMGLLNLAPQPATPPPEGAVAFGMAMMKTGYLFQFVKGTEVLVGALLLSNRFVPLALAIAAPVVLNIVAFHAFLAPEGLALPIVLLALHVFLAWSYRSLYRPMLASRAKPG
ncbi:DoxX family protein [Pyxidicoccus parkwayensis]|uniref:DoxX family protein n=1 Tax=Pyxidicoccus parkwayensis TaxID=2813578 RepID=A0ABX7P509_9BACT|nr:DoxX family protein [Pyxidicoccus parkwaysis]QSQ25516.1 DoxX family protein [Pyxidicoccus parkwaysis]